MLVHTRSLSYTAFDAWRSPGRFTKNPDMIELPSGRLLLVYSDNDAHWSLETQILTILASDDGGRTWSKLSEVARADLSQGDERLVTPRLSLLNDGRLVVLIDHDDYGHFHEDQPSGNWAFWSEDDGATWSEAQVTGILGFEPDRVIDLPDGRLAVVSHLMRGDSQEFAVILTCSDDRGATWYETATIAHDGYHRFCEGALVLLDGGEELACVMRENHSAGRPSFVAFSRDGGRTWSAAQMAPFALHRPYAKQLQDGRVLVTGRNVNGGLGTYAWCGDLRNELGHQIGGPRHEYTAELTPEALVITNVPGQECRYTLLPPETSSSEVVYEAEVRVEGAPGEKVAFMSLSTLRPLGPGGLVLALGPDSIALGARGGTDFRQPVDLTTWRTVTIRHRRGLLHVQVDGKTLINQCIFREPDLERDFHGGIPARRTQFGQLGETGQSFWRKITYRVTNPTLPAIDWSWQAASGERPDEYQRRRLIQLHPNHPDQKPWPDHGYSSWVQHADGRITFVDYTNCGDVPDTAHIVGLIIDPADLA